MATSPRPDDVSHASTARTPRRGLNAFFSAKSVALIGATERSGTVGYALLANLLKGAAGRKIFPVNPKHTTVCGMPAYPSVGAIAEPVDLAVIATPAATVPDVVRQCADAGVQVAVIISAGFKEMGAEGAALEQRILEISRHTGMRIIGPNCLGVMSPFADLNATFAAASAERGNVAFLSQSGALCSAILDWSIREKVGFSAFVSTGSMLDVSWGDLIDYLADDPRTKSILIYMESVGDARSFLSAAREAGLTKPIVILKSGRSEPAAKAAASHTGAMAGSDEALDAAFRRAGVLRVNSVAELFYMAETLSKQPRPKGPRLTIVTNAGGAGVLATDSLISTGGQLATLAPESITQLNATLPPHWSRGNPIDILGDADPARYASATKIAAEDPSSDGILIILTPQEMSDPTATATALAPFAHAADKPVIANWMGGESVEAGATILRQAGIPVFRYPDTAARAFHYLWQYTDNLRTLYETPASCVDEQIPCTAVSHVIDNAMRSGRTLLTEAEAKELLSAYRIQNARTEVAQSADQALAKAKSIGFPVVLKLLSATITHKSDVGGVILNLTTAAEVQSAYETIQQRITTLRGAQHFDGVTVQPMIRSKEGYELIIGSKIDAQFGPIILFGTGGEFAELMQDHALGLPPLNATLARRIIERTKIHRALRGFRGRKPVDVSALEQLLVRFSQLVLDHPRVKEIEINPLLVSADQMIALDARAVLFGSEVPDSALPRPAIRPYPQEYVSQWTLKDGTSLSIRPIRPEDEPLVADFHKSISDLSVQQRYFHAMSLAARIHHDRLSRVCFNDYDREIALVAEAKNPEHGRSELLGIARLIKLNTDSSAEFAIIISDRAQKQGLGSEFMRRLIDIGKREGISKLTASILRINRGMLRICEAAGFHFSGDLTSDVVDVSRSID